MAVHSDYIALATSVYYERQVEVTNDQEINTLDKPLAYLQENDWSVRPVSGFQNTASGFFATAFENEDTDEVHDWPQSAD